MSKLILAGKVNSLHGVKGLLKIYSYLESPENFSIYSFYLKDGLKLPLRYKFSKKNQAICQLDGVIDTNHASEYIGKEIFIKRDDLPDIKEDNEFYYSELVGIKVIDSDNESTFGEVVAVHNFGAGDLLEIKTSNNNNQMFSFNDKIFPKLDINKGYVKIKQPEIEFHKEED